MRKIVINQNDNVLISGEELNRLLENEMQDEPKLKKRRFVRKRLRNYPEQNLEGVSIRQEELEKLLKENGYDTDISSSNP